MSDENLMNFALDEIKRTTGETAYPLTFAPGYFVTRSGRVFSMRTRRTDKEYRDRPFEMKQTPHSTGSRRVFLHIDKQPVAYSVSRLIALAIIGKPEGAQRIRHKDNDPSNIHANNIEWIVSKKYERTAKLRRSLRRCGRLTT